MPKKAGYSEIVKMCRQLAVSTGLLHKDDGKVLVAKPWNSQFSDPKGALEWAWQGSSLFPSVLRSETK